MSETLEEVKQQFADILKKIRKHELEGYGLQLKRNEIAKKLCAFTEFLHTEYDLRDLERQRKDLVDEINNARELET